jgi:hypothetical protein
VDDGFKPFLSFQAIRERGLPHRYLVEPARFELAFTILQGWEVPGYTQGPMVGH